MTGKLCHVGMTVAFLFLSNLSGCASYSTWPSVEMTGRMINPSSEPLPTIMTKAIRYAQRHYAAGEADFAINLPEGIHHETYTRVIRKLGTGHPWTDPAENAIHVLEIRVRGYTAEVDLVYPRRGSIYELVTITFSRRLVEGWVVLSSRLWRIHVEIPTMNYIAPVPTVLPKPEEPGIDPPDAATQPEAADADLLDLLDEPDEGGDG